MGWMDKKTMTLNKWFHAGAHAAWSGKTLAEGEAAFTEKPTVHQLADYRNGYYTGRNTHAIDWLRNMLKYLNRSELIEMADTLEPLVMQWERDWFGLELKPGLQLPDREPPQ